MPIGNTASRADGLRAIELTSELKILPIPAPTPARARTATPAPIILAEARSIVISPGQRWAERRTVAGLPTSMEVDGVAQVETGEDGENVGLENGDQDLEDRQRHIERQRQQPERQQEGAEADRKGREDLQHRVTRHHVGEESDREADRAGKVGQHLD